MVMRLCVGILAFAATASANAQTCPTPTPQQVKATGVFEAAITKAKKLGTPKGQFETTTAYNARMATAIKEIAPHGDLIFPWVADLDTFSYDADTETVKYPTMVLSTFCLVNPSDDAYTLSQPSCFQQQFRSVRGKPQIMQNAFGTKVVGSSVKEDYVGVAYGKGGLGEKSIDSDGTDLFSFNAPPDLAKSLKSHAVLWVDIVPAPPLYMEGSLDIDATIDDPTEVYGESYLLVGKFKCLSIADSQTGQVFQTIDLTDRTPDPEASGSIEDFINRTPRTLNRPTSSLPSPEDIRTGKAPIDD
jgi:hypothetical protein